MSIIAPTTVDYLISESDASRASEDDGNLTENEKTNGNYPLLVDLQSSPNSSASENRHLSQASLSSGSSIEEEDASPIEEYHLSDENAKIHNRRLPIGWVFWALRWPLLAFIMGIIFVELIFYFLVRKWVSIHENWFVWRGRKRRLRSALENARTYEKWRDAALNLDRYMKKDAWKQQQASAFYDHRLIQRMNRLMSSYRAAIEADSRNPVPVQRLKRALLDGSARSNLGGVENIFLYTKTYHGTKELVEEYVQDVIKSLRCIYESPLLQTEEKYKFFHRASKAYGRSALCLSGGATFGYFHLGVIKALFEYDRLPSVITGTSAGSLIAYFLCTRTDAELKKDLTPELYQRFTACDLGIFERARNYWNTGAMFVAEHWREKLKWIGNGEMTFHEAFVRTGRILNITVVSEEEHSPPKLLNYKTAPDVLIFSAVLASSAVPGLLPPISLYRKLEDGRVVPYLDEGRRWCDGSLRVDIPIISLHQMFKVNYTIVSQVNPHVICFFFESRGACGNPTAHRQGDGWRGGFLASTLECSLKLDLKKWLRVIRDLQLMPFFKSQDWSYVWLQKFDGSITILPSVSISDYIRILTDPTRDRMERYIQKGELSTWPTLHMVGNRLKIEHCIERCRERLRRELLKNNN